MSANGIQIQELPDLKNPLMIAGFDGWGQCVENIKRHGRLSDSHL
jgi:hypothetical protein